jgi:hypothetical protein
MLEDAMVDFQRIFELTRWLDDLLSGDPIRFESLAASSLPPEGGVYFISDLSQRNEIVVYVGLTGNLRKRVYTQQLQGHKESSQIKVAIIQHGRARDHAQAKEYLRRRCAVRFDAIPDYREREMREGFAKGVLKPEFSLYKSKEH